MRESIIIKINKKMIKIRKYDFDLYFFIVFYEIINKLY